MTFIYIQIVFLTLFGDLLKRWLSPSSALSLEYVLAGVLFMEIIFLKIRRRPRIAFRNLNVRLLERSFIFCIVSYFICFLFTLIFSPTVPFKNVFSTTSYICFPMLFTLAIYQSRAKLDLLKIGFWFCLCMIPANIVGVIQYAWNPDFFISTAYQESGGLIERNLFEGLGQSSFTRYPSIFVSADRYSAIGLVQFYYALMLLLAPLRKKGSSYAWGTLNLLSSFLALLIAGARARILIAMATLILLGLLIAKSRKAFSGFIKMLPKMFIVILLSIILLFVLSYFKPGVISTLEEKFSDMPIIGFVNKTLSGGDINSRTTGYLSSSFNFSQMSFFGTGMGSFGNGKPAETGIMSIFIESGIFGGAFILIGFLGIIWALASLSIKAFFRNNSFHFVGFWVPTLTTVMGLLTGLTSAFEISSGLLLCINVSMMMHYADLLRTNQAGRYKKDY